MRPLWRCKYCGTVVKRYNRTCADCRDLPALDPGIGEATIQAYDLPESTIYVLVEDGIVTATAHWPHPLERLRPDATRLPCYSGDSGHALVVHVGANIKSSRA